MSGWSSLKHSLSQSLKICCILIQRFDRRVCFDRYIPRFVHILDSILESDSCEWNLSSSLCESAACISPCVPASAAIGVWTRSWLRFHQTGFWLILFPDLDPSTSQLWVNSVAVCGVHLDPSKKGRRRPLGCSGGADGVIGDKDCGTVYFGFICGFRDTLNI